MSWVKFPGGEGGLAKEQEEQEQEEQEQEQQQEQQEQQQQQEQAGRESRKRGLSRVQRPGGLPHHRHLALLLHSVRRNIPMPLRLQLAVGDRVVPAELEPGEVANVLAATQRK